MLPLPSLIPLLQLLCVDHLPALICTDFHGVQLNISNDENLNFDNGYDWTETELSGGALIMHDLQDQLMHFSTGLRRQRTGISYPDLLELSAIDEPKRDGGG
ncbi:hypothetical protein E3N88_10040 [Mikania micrantha]|uniref:Uncharacterized protein n=1 Tax=Mikania micrantha TaxID=192012 RepID=A0A5N6PAN9_9ASTR|nr:hypothetical protein E3N88_10040 [Mikania micrantha]